MNPIAYHITALEDFGNGYTCGCCGRWDYDNEYENTITGTLVDVANDLIDHIATQEDNHEATYNFHSVKINGEEVPWMNKIQEQAWRLYDFRKKKRSLSDENKRAQYKLDTALAAQERKAAALHADIDAGIYTVKGAEIRVQELAAERNSVLDPLFAEVQKTLDALAALCNEYAENSIDIATMVQA